MNHNLLNLTDKLSLIGELEHIRRHAKRSAKVAEESEDKLFYQVIAANAQSLRRDYQAKYLDTPELDWCLVKSAATLKQLAYESEDDEEFFERLETLTDQIYTHAFKQDMSGCKACAEDKEQKSS